MSRHRRHRDAEKIRRLVRDNQTSAALCEALTDFVTQVRAAERGEWLARTEAAEGELRKLTQNS